MELTQELPTQQQDVSIEQKRQGRSFTSKTCPRCGATLFEDMSICYGCLYDFDREPAHFNELPPCEESSFFVEGERPHYPEEMWEPSDLGESKNSMQELSKQRVAQGLSTDPDSTTVLKREEIQGAPSLLVIELGPNLVKLPISAEGVTIGRDASCNVVLSDRTVSREHLKIFLKDSRLCCEDLNATNPTLVNGVELRGERSVGKGTVLDVCGVHFVVA